MAILEAERRYGTISIEVYVLFEERWEAVVWLYAVEGTIDIFWNRARRLKLKDVGFEARRLIEALEEASIRKLDLVAGPVAFVVVRRGWLSKAEDVRHSVR